MNDSVESSRPVKGWSSAPEQQFAAPGGQPSSKRIWRLLLILAAIAVVYFVAKPGREDRTRGRFHAAVGTSLAWATLDPLLNADTPIGADDVAGHVTLVNFWGPWCPPCREEFPALLSLRESLQKEPQFRYISVACAASFDEPETTLRDDTRAYLDWLKQQPPIHVDRDAVLRRRLASAAKFEDFAYPTTVLLDGQGAIRGVWVGYHSGEEENMLAAVTELLASVHSPPEASR